MSSFPFVWHEEGSPQVLLLLHGTGGDEHDLVQIGRVIAPGWSLLGVRGKVSENGANRFFKRFAEGVFDPVDLAFRTQELADWLVGKERPWHRLPLVAFGYSNGANMAANLLLTGTGVLTGAVMLRPMVPSEPLAGLQLNGVMAQIQIGSADPICPPEDGSRLGQLLAAAGAEVKVLETGRDHGLTQADVTSAAEFVAKL